MQGCLLPAVWSGLRVLAAPAAQLPRDVQHGAALGPQDQQPRQQRGGGAGDIFVFCKIRGDSDGTLFDNPCTKLLWEVLS